MTIQAGATSDLLVTVNHQGNPDFRRSLTIYTEPSAGPVLLDFIGVAVADTGARAKPTHSESAAKGYVTAPDGYMWAPMKPIWP